MAVDRGKIIDDLKDLILTLQGKNCKEIRQKWSEKLDRVKVAIENLSPEDLSWVSKEYYKWFKTTIGIDKSFRI